MNVRRTGLTDEAFQTLVHVLQQSPSLHTLDLSDNELSITSVLSLSFRIGSLLGSRSKSKEENEHTRLTISQKRSKNVTDHTKIKLLF